MVCLRAGQGDQVLSVGTLAGDGALDLLRQVQHLCGNHFHTETQWKFLTHGFLYATSGKFTSLTSF